MPRTKLKVSPLGLLTSAMMLGILLSEALQLYLNMVIVIASRLEKEISEQEKGYKSHKNVRENSCRFRNVQYHLVTSSFVYFLRPVYPELGDNENVPLTNLCNRGYATLSAKSNKTADTSSIDCRLYFSLSKHS